MNTATSLKDAVSANMMRGGAPKVAPKGKRDAKKMREIQRIKS